MLIDRYQSLCRASQ